MLMASLFLSIVFMLFFLSTHPLMMGFMLMLTSIIYGFMMYFINYTSWLTYILIMIFVSGMMIIFIYMASLSSNEPINLLIKSLFKMMIVTLPVMISLFIFMKQLKLKNSNLNTINQYFKEQSMEIIYKTYNKMMFEMTMLLTIYLLIVLIVSVKLINNFKMPLRSSK